MLKGVSSVIPYITYIPVLLFSFEYKIYIVCEGIVCLHVLKHVYWSHSEIKEQEEEGVWNEIR